MRPRGGVVRVPWTPSYALVFFASDLVHFFIQSIVPLLLTHSFISFDERPLNMNLDGGALPPRFHLHLGSFQVLFFGRGGRIALSSGRHL